MGFPVNKLSFQDRASLIKLASSLPAGDETRKAILAGLSKTSAVKAVEPYKSGEGVPYNRTMKKDVLKVKNERELRQLSDFLDKLYSRSGNGSKPISITPSEAKVLQKWGVNPETFSKTFGNYMLFVTDATGTEYDVFNDLGIGG